MNQRFGIRKEDESRDEMQHKSLKLNSFPPCIWFNLVSFLTERLSIVNKCM